MRFLPAALIAVALAGLAVPAVAAFSDSYTFLKAVKDRDAFKAQTIIREPGSTVINTRDGDGDQALHMVTKARDLFWVRLLLANGADINGRDAAGNTPLILAAGNGFVDGARQLLQLRARVNLANGRGETALIKAVQMRDVDAVTVLLGAGANADQADSFAGMSARDYAKQDRRAGQILKLIETNKAAPAAASMGPSK